MVKQVENKRPPRRSPYQRLRDSIKLPTFKSRLWDAYKRIERASKTLNFFLRSSPIQFSPFPGYAIRYNGRPTNISFYDFKTTVYQGECNVTITKHRKFVLGFYEVIQDLHFRNPNCSLKRPPLEEYEYQCNPSPKCEGDGRAVYIWWLNSKIEYYDNFYLNKEHALFWLKTELTSTIDSVTFPEEKYIYSSDGTKRYKVYATIEHTNYYSIQSNYDWFNNVIEVNEENTLYEYKNTLDIVYGRLGRFALGTPGNILIGDTAGVANTYYSSFANEKKRSYREILSSEHHIFPYNYRTIVSSGLSGITGENVTPYRSGYSYPVDFYYDGLGFKVQDLRNWHKQWCAKRTERIKNYTGDIIISGRFSCSIR